MGTCPILRTPKLETRSIASLTPRLHIHGFASSSIKASTDGIDTGLKLSRGPDVPQKRELRRGFRTVKPHLYSPTLARYLAGTILIPDPSRVVSTPKFLPDHLLSWPLMNIRYKEKADVIKNLPKLFFPFQRALRKVTVFITPEFVQWLDGDNFIQDAVNHMYQGWSDVSKDRSDPSLDSDYKYTVQSRVAVVDRLPFTGGRNSGYPGISVALTPRGRRWFSKSEYEQRKIVQQGSRVPYISVKVPFSDKDDEKKHVKVYLRPANTLFINGRQSTMFLEDWALHKDATGGPKFLKEGERGDLDHVTILHRSQESSLSMLLHKLTKRQTISLCMGNIISKLVGEQDAEPMSASFELEEQVSAFMKRKDATNGTLSVFALIIPKVGADNESTNNPAVPLDFLGYRRSVEMKEIDMESDRTLDDIKYEISKGAHLHRVTSGGGGWGKKQGLLSLEPAMDLTGEEPNLASHVMSQHPQEAEDGASAWSQAAAPEIVRPGDEIEFYGIFLPKEENPSLVDGDTLMTTMKVPDIKQWNASKWAKAKKSNIIFGVIPPQDSYDANKGAHISHKLITIPHQFGMLSENGLALHKLDKDILNRTPADIAIHGPRHMSVTRIDVPHTVLSYSIPNRDVRQDIHWRKVKTTSTEGPIQPIDLEAGRKDEVEFLRGRKGKHDSWGTRVIILDDDLEEPTVAQQASTTGKTEFEDDHQATSPGRSSESPGGRGNRGRRGKEAQDSGVEIVKYDAPVLLRKHQAGR